MRRKLFFLILLLSSLLRFWILGHWWHNYFNDYEVTH